MNGWVRTICVFWVALGFCGVYAQRDVEVRPAGKEVFEALPKEIITTAFQVTNRSPHSLEMVSRVSLPEGWRLVTREFPFQLDSLGSGGETDIRLISFFVPGTARPGEYVVTYRVEGRGFPGASDRHTIGVRVLPWRDLRVDLIETPKYVIAGDAYTVSFLVTNESNMADSVKIQMDSDPSFKVSPRERLFLLRSGESRLVDVNVRTESDLKAQIKHRLHLRVFLAGHPDIAASGYSYVKVIPRITGVQDRYHRLPVTVSGRYVTQKEGGTRSGVQGEIRGEGTLNEAGTQQIAFQMRGPDIYDTSILAERDRYLASFSTKQLSLHIGDRPYTLSLLTEYARFGRGIEGRFRWKDLEAGGFFQEARWLWPERRQIGSFIRYSSPRNHQIGLNVLYKRRDGGETAGIVSLEGAWSPTRSTQVQAEYALGDGAKDVQLAYRLRITGQTLHSSYFFETIRAESDFPGYFYDTHYISGNASVHLSDRFRVNANLRFDRQNFEVDTTRYTAPYTRYCQVGFYYRVTKSISLTFDGIGQSREDRLPEPNYDYQEATGKVGIGYFSRYSNFYVSAELGRTDNRLIDHTFHSKKFTLSSYVKPWTGHTYRLFAVLSENARYTGTMRRRMTLGINVSLQVTPSTYFSLDMQSYYSPEEMYRDRNLFEFQLKQRLFDMHLFILRGRHTALRNSLHRKDTAFLFEYQIPVGIPIARRSRIGIVSGVVTDRETGEPIENVIIRINGSTAVTDRRGRYIFPSLKPGEYYLTVDRAGIGLDRITAQKLPLFLSIRGGDEQQISLQVTRRAELSGRVIVYEESEGEYTYRLGVQVNGDRKPRSDIPVFSNKDDKQTTTQDRIRLIASRGLGGVVVEISNGDEVQRRVAERDGSFDFNELRPGRWNIRVYDSGLPPNHQIGELPSVIELDPGEKKILEIPVLPKKRRIRMLQEGGALEEETE
jgi:hypothetical protein